MGSLPAACGSFRASGANGVFSPIIRRLVLLLTMLLLGERLVDCEGTESHTQVLTATSSYPQCAGLTAHIRDGHCNEANNNADCGFDGGDCCASTCVAGLAHACGGRHHEGGFDCRDPREEIAAPRRRLDSESCGGFPGNIGDTKCDSANNNFECSYDGGDCCECTCSPDLLAALVEEAYLINFCLDGEFDCLDPACDSGSQISVPNPTPGPVYVRPVPSPTGSPVPPPTGFPVTSPSASPVASPTVSIVTSPTPVPASSPTLTTSGCGWPDSYIGDGDCDYGTNNLECNWDGGDCCECTCQETYDYQCPSFDCLDPYAPTDCGSTSFWTTIARSAVSPVPSPIHASPAPTPRETPGQESPGEMRPVSRATERPVSSPTETPEGSGSRDAESDSSFTGSGNYADKERSTGEGSSSLTSGDRSVGEGSSYTDSDSSTDGGGVEEEHDDDTEEVVSTSSATRLATTGKFVVWNWEVVAVLCASGLGYYTS